MKEKISRLVTWVFMVFSIFLIIFIKDFKLVIQSILI